MRRAAVDAFSEVAVRGDDAAIKAVAKHLEDEDGGVRRLVERFDTEPFSDFFSQMSKL